MTIAPGNKVVAAIRTTARKLGKDELSMRQIDAEIRAYREEAAQLPDQGRTVPGRYSRSSTT